MAYLNEQERDKLMEDLSKMKFGKAKGKLARMDAKGRLVYYRNVQQSGEWHTKYVLEGLGTEVTLIEVNKNQNDSAKNNQDYDFVRIVVEPTAANQT